MFKFLKDKLKNAIKRFSKDVDEEAVEEKPEKKPEEEEAEEIKEEVHAVEETAKDTKEPKKHEEQKKPSAETSLEWEPPIEKKVKKAEEVAREETPEEEKDTKAEKIDGVRITYFVHGTTTDNENDLATGQEPGELSALGKKQAAELGSQAETRFDTVFCSDLKRAVESARLGFEDAKIITDKRLREIDYGDFTGKPCSDFKKDLVKYIKEPFPSGESYTDVGIRIADFLNYLYKDYYGKHVAIIAHQAPQLAIEVLLKNRTWEQAISEDWRLKKAWQPGWDYKVIHEIEEVKKEEDTTEEKAVKEKPVPAGEDQDIDIEKPVEIEPVKMQPQDTGEQEIKQDIKDTRDDKEKGEKKRGIFGMIKDRVTKRSLPEEKFNNLFWNLEVALMENNVAMDVIDKIKNDLKVNLVETRITIGKTGEIIRQSLEKSIDGLFDADRIQLISEIRKKKPYVMLFVGVNGAGKTTTIAKVARLLQKNSLSSVIAASDTFRAAAMEQLEEHAKNLNVRLIKHDYGSDPAAVAFDAVKYAQAKGVDAVLIDTAGRQHSNTNLMEELKKVARVAKPDIKIFVGESITGNDCIEQAQQFNDAIGVDAIILSKADVDEKGGAAISISYVTKKPILYLGTGQDYDSLQEFDKSIVTGNLGLA